MINGKILRDHAAHGRAEHIGVFHAQLPEGEQLSVRQQEIVYAVFAQIEDAVDARREKLMAEAFDDMRALKLLESKIGRDATLALCEAHLGEVNSRLMLQGEVLRELREAVNAKTAEHA